MALRTGARTKCLRTLLEGHILTANVRKADQLLYFNSFVRIYSVATVTMLKFLNSKCKRSPCYDVIRTDVDRTYVRSESSLAIRKYLVNVLSAVAANFPRLGYVQGLNYLARNMYENELSESQAFALMSFLLTEQHLEELYLNGLQRVTEYCYVLDVYLFNFIPDLYHYLHRVDIDVMYFAAGWFITLFAEQLPTRVVNRVWNMFLLKGWKVLIKFAIALLMAFRKEIMERSRDTLSTYLRYFLETNFTPKKEDEVFRIFLSIKVTNKMVEFFAKKMTQVERDSQISLRRMRKNSADAPIEVSMRKTNSSFSHDSQQNWCYCQIKKAPRPQPTAFSR